MSGFLSAIAASFSAAVVHTWSAIQTFAHGNFALGDSDASHKVTIQTGNETADRVLSIPVLGAAANVVVTVAAQSIGGAKTFTDDVQVGEPTAGLGQKLLVYQTNSGGATTPGFDLRWTNDPSYTQISAYVAGSGYGSIVLGYSHPALGWRMWISGDQFFCGSGGQLGFSSAADPYGSAADTVFIRSAAGLFQVKNVLNANGGCIEYLQRATAFPTISANCAGTGALDVAGTAEFFAVNEAADAYQLTGLANMSTSDEFSGSVTLANSAELILNLLAGKKYSGQLVAVISTDQIAEGFKFDFDGGTATMTVFEAAVTANVQGATLGVSVSSALATDLTGTALSGTTKHTIVIDINMIVNAAGTFKLRLAQNTHVSGTLTLHAGSTLKLRSAA